MSMFDPEHPGWHLVTPVDLARAPWRSICEIEVRDPGGVSGVGTGWLVGSRTIVTAAHVLAIQADAPDVSVNVHFPRMPQRFTAVQRAIHPRFGMASVGKLDPFDIAALFVPDVVGTPLRIGTFPSIDGSIELSGFPEISGGSCVTQVSHAIRPDSDIVLYKADAAGGHSGAPIVARVGALDGVVVALHVIGFGGNPHDNGLWNVGLGLDGERRRFLQDQLLAWEPIARDRFAVGSR